MLHKISSLIALASDHVLVVRARRARQKPCALTRKNLMFRLSERANKRTRTESRYRQEIADNNTLRRDTLKLIVRIKGEISELEKESTNASREYIARQVELRCANKSTVEADSTYSTRMAKAIERADRLRQLNLSLWRHKRLLWSLGRESRSLSRVANSMRNRAELLSSIATALV